jgi:hypothetical protein
MPTTLIVFGVLSIIQIALLIIFIVMLIKQFKHGGALHGVIGLITCGFWTYIWGWMKHKSLALTKAMIVWTVLMIVPWALVGVLGAAMVNEMVAVAQSIMQEGGLDEMQKQMDQKGVSISFGPKSKKSSKQSTRQGAGQWSKMAVALWQDGKYADPDKALAYWNKAIRANPKSPEAYNNRGVAYYNLKRYPQAVKDYNQAIRMRPEDAIAFNNRGNAYYEMSKYEPAVSDYNKSIGLNPQYANAYLNRGLVHYQMDKDNQACADFKKACDLKECEGLDWARQEGVCQDS